MKNKVYKTLIYFFYCRNDIHEYKEVFDLHLELLKQNINIFNYSKFILAVNDLNNNELIDFYKNYIKDYLCVNDNFEFIVVQNDPLNREGIHFYYEIAKKLNDYDGLLFFGHNKSDLTYDKRNIYDWIIGAHFINFYNIEDIENKLINDKYIAYGSFPKFVLNQTWEGESRYMYWGSFFWINPKKIISNHSTEVSFYNEYFDMFFQMKKTNSYIKSIGEFKYYAEYFLGNICNFYSDCTTLNNAIIPIYMYNGLPSQTLICGYNKIGYHSPMTQYYLTENQNIEFNKYFNSICKKLNILFNK